VNIPQAERIGRLKYAIRNIANAALQLESEGRRVLYLNIGDPLLYDFQTPPELVEAVYKAMRDGKNYYAPSYGIPIAREAIATHLEHEGVDVAPGHVYVTSGASEAIEAAMTAMLNPGDNVLTPLPGYPLYSAVLCKLSVQERGYRLLADADWNPDFDHMESLVDGRTRAIVVINPNNPTGAVWDEATLERVVDFARRHDLVIFADEVYHTITYDEPPTRLASIAGDVPVIAFDSLSKSYLATGWRVGWMTLHGQRLLGDLKGAIERILDARLCSPTPPQFAIPVALEGERAHLTVALAKFRQRRDLLVERLQGIPGFTCEAPKGAFYAMPRFRHLNGRTDEEFVLDVLRTAGVLAVHGSGFGLDPHDGYFRIVYLPPVETLSAAVDGLAETAAKWTAAAGAPV
jgi:alanine-synthesizing transaminase